MTLEQIFDRLRERYGSYRKTAAALGFHPVHFCALRNGRTTITPRTEEYIRLTAQKLGIIPSPPEPPHE